jgi:hypothetical protein
VFDRAGDHRVEFDFTAKVSREVGKVGRLLDDGTLGLCLVPPTEFGCVFTGRRGVGGQTMARKGYDLRATH